MLSVGSGSAGALPTHSSPVSARPTLKATLKWTRAKRAVLAMAGPAVREVLALEARRALQSDRACERWRQALPMADPVPRRAAARCVRPACPLTRRRRKPAQWLRAALRDAGRCSSRAGTAATARRPGRSDPGAAWIGRSQPVSRVLSRTVIPLGPASPQGSSNLPEGNAGRAIAFLFGLAPDGVCRAVPVARSAVRSYRTVSPLPRVSEDTVRRSVLCCTFRRLTPPRRYLASRPVEPGLSSKVASTLATIRPTSRRAVYALSIRAR